MPTHDQLVAKVAARLKSFPRTRVIVAGRVYADGEDAADAELPFLVVRKGRDHGRPPDDEGPVLCQADIRVEAHAGDEAGAGALAVAVQKALVGFSDAVIKHAVLSDTGEPAEDEAGDWVRTDAYGLHHFVPPAPPDRPAA